MQIYSTANYISRSMQNSCHIIYVQFFFFKKWHALKFPLFGINCILKIVKSVPGHLDRIPILYFFILKMPKIPKSVLKTACTPEFYTYFLRLYTLKCRNRRLKKKWRKTKFICQLGNHKCNFMRRNSSSYDLTSLHDQGFIYTVNCMGIEVYAYM